MGSECISTRKKKTVINIGVLEDTCLDCLDLLRNCRLNRFFSIQSEMKFIFIVRCHVSKIKTEHLLDEIATEIAIFWWHFLLIRCCIESLCRDATQIPKPITTTNIWNELLVE